MVYIKGLKFRGFKSFRKAEATFPRGYVCLAGPNGSGKSNVTDGIRFALGEASLKALRAKRVAELINTSCKFAEVTLFIDGEQQYEIRRAINSDGKTLYRINGKRSTRTLIMEELRQHGLEAGSHNIIAQGQVQKIIEMSSKERRQIIDGVSGIAEFDAKKEEALRELQKVEQKITEASIVLGEREALLTELEKEKNDALSYLSAKENFTRAMASIAASEYAKLNKTHTDVVQKVVGVSAAKEELARQSAVLNGRISELSEQKQQIVVKISASGSREVALREIEELKVKAGAQSATMEEKRKEERRLEYAVKSLEKQLESLKAARASAEEAAKSLSEEAKKLSPEIAALEKSTGMHGGETAQSRLETVAQKIMSLKERKASLEASLSNAGKMLSVRQEEKKRLQEAVGESRGAKSEGERELLQKELLSHEAALEALFEKEKELNRALPDLDRRLLSLKEKAATLRASLSPAATSLALRVVDELKSGGMKGIYGAVSSLVACEPKYSASVEAAAGQRLNYVVVDRMDTAVKVIAKLKESRSGRCTFIPLDTVRSSDSAPKEKPAGCLGPLLDFVDFDAAFLPAMQYVFSGTLLFDSVQDAKKAGVGFARMVTLDGELLEKSGIITGGAQKGSLLSRAGLEKAESEAESVKKERDSLYSQLYSLRDEMAAKRKEKAAVEIKLKSIEIELGAAHALQESGRRTIGAIKEIDSHISSIGKEISSAEGELASLASQLSQQVSEYESLKQKQAQEAEAARHAGEEAHRRLTELHSQRSALQASHEAKKAEISRLSGELAEKEKEASDSSSRFSECEKEIAGLRKDLDAVYAIQSEKEKKLADLSTTSQKLLSKLNEFEREISDIGSQLGKLRVEDDRRSRELMELEVKRQTAETRLADLKAALEQYAGVPTIDATKTELEELSAKSRVQMDALGNVNLRAPELYDEKKKDIEEIKGRVASLDGEKKAVFSMMDELEGRKRAIFISTFDSVNANFKRLFGYVFPGEGMLLLEHPDAPFESGLLVKVRDERHEKYLDSMSGGEKSLLALIFIFAIQMHKAAPFYILDEADAALDKENSRKLADLIKQLAGAGKTQFIVVTHNDTVLSNADVALGVTRTDDGSKIVGVQLTSAAAVARPKKAPQ